MRLRGTLLFALGFVLGSMCVQSVFASGLLGNVKSAEFKDIKLLVNGASWELDNYPLAVVKDGENNATTYLPVRELSNMLGYDVLWDGEDNRISLKSNIAVDEEDGVVTVTKRVKVNLGYINIPLCEVVEEGGVKWRVTQSEGSGIKIYEEPPRLSDGKTVRAFTFGSLRSVGEGVTTVTFEKIVNEEPVGYTIVYEVEVLPDTPDMKPVIYLYPQEKMDVAVMLDYDGVLETTYPKYDTENGWRVTAYPDGTLIGKDDGLEYSYLFWDGRSAAGYDFSEGFVVRGEDTAEFLRDKLSYMGLTAREYNEFIVFWLPLMEGNMYNLIAFQKEAYTDRARLEIFPEPDSVLRVFMAFTPLDEYVETEPQRLEPFKREGFTVVEWGGAIVETAESIE